MEGSASNTRNRQSDVVIRFFCIFLFCSFGSSLLFSVCLSKLSLFLQLHVMLCSFYVSLCRRFCSHFSLRRSKYALFLLFSNCLCFAAVILSFCIFFGLPQSVCICVLILSFCLFASLCCCRLILFLRFFAEVLSGND